VNGIHDMGGMQGFGPVPREENEPVFHAPWERSVYAISRIRGLHDLFTMDEMRHGVERIPPADYLESSYYARWIAAFDRVLVEKGVLTREEIDARIAHFAAHSEAEATRREDPALVERLTATLRARPSFERPPSGEPRFGVGDRVVTRNIHPRGHTRLPRYARGKRGTISAVHGYHVFPDTNAHGEGEQPQPLYSVCFEARELWDGAAEAGQSLYLDLWESYLEPA
jgi:nitrile hydratase